MEQPQPPTPPPPGAKAEASAPRRRLGLGAVVLVAIAAGLLAWLVIDNSNTSDSAPPTPTVPATGPAVLSATGLKTLAAAVGQPIYWAGPEPNMFYELTRTADAKVYIRYLPPDIKAGAPTGDYLIIATYPFAGAYEALEKTANGKEQAVPGGGIAVVDGGQAESVHLAFPDVPYQVEVYDPSAERALEVALSGDVKPVVAG